VCWQVKPNEDLAVPKPAKYIVPSWSWASVNRSIFRKSYGYDNWPRHLTIVTRVLSFNTIPKSRDSALGQLKGGLLRMIFSKMACGRLEYKYPQQLKITAADDRNTLFFNEDKLDVNWDFPITNEYRKRVSLLPIILKKGFYVIDSRVKDFNTIAEAKKDFNTTADPAHRLLKTDRLLRIYFHVSHALLCSYSANYSFPP
jgi:hypothetical protein